jgi:hypothetical protein|tara:strand:- start:160 stop:522 length:363 start_codon:yes stop_codon:yes gene_type:complete
MDHSRPFAPNEGYATNIVPQNYYTHQAQPNPTGIEDIPAMLLEQGLVGIGLLVMGFTIWTLFKRKEKLDDKIIELVKDNQGVIMSVTQSIDRMNARVDKDLEGVDVRLQNVEREVERIGR